MRHGERHDGVVLPYLLVPGAELDQIDVVGQLPEDPAQAAEELVEAARAVHGERNVPPAEREGLEHPRQTEEVVRVIVGQEDLAHVDEADARPQQLALCPLAAVEEQPLAAPAYERGGDAAPSGGRRGGGAEEDDVEVHPGRF